jgi:predicted RNase H-like nuclease (RuvC/YqgF family)
VAKKEAKCYDYDNKMAVGNIHTQNVSQIWNGSEFRDLRRKVTCERNSLNKCKNCNENFKLSESGWFVESINFSKEREAEVESLKARLQESDKKIEKFENEIREIHRSIVWQLLTRYHEGIAERAQTWDNETEWGESIQRVE